jgi:hypothetical protein
MQQYVDVIVLVHGIDAPLSDASKDLQYIATNLEKKWNINRKEQDDGLKIVSKWHRK